MFLFLKMPHMKINILMFYWKQGHVILQGKKHNNIVQFYFCS